MYNESGALVDGGGDLDLGGVTSYYHDLIYLTAAVQLGSLLSRHVWWLFAAVRCLTCLLHHSGSVQLGRLL